MPEIENAPNNNRDRILPLARHLPPQSQAEEPPPRRERQPESLRFRTLRRKGPDPTRRFAPHALRYACLRGAGDSGEERLRRSQSRRLVLRCDFVRVERWLLTFQRSESHGHVSENLQRRISVPEMDVSGSPPVHLGELERERDLPP